MHLLQGISQDCKRRNVTVGAVDDVVEACALVTILSIVKPHAGSNTRRETRG